ncbi:GRB2-associated-binding protein 1-like [Betta splendens]|uniref:GRB2-associated-binding protein 1-like n=1 Tax=Betta splendens TaxID=158456 RepID=A0A6P7PAP7_BETSP|nr:GRB2-associated-binding protein 1-like [Betta splendens]
MSGAGDVVCEGWLRKSPPEKKLRRYAWKRRWFVLRSGRLTGEPDVLQYYKNPQSRRPIRTINLNLCEQVDAGLSFTKKELESSFVFDLRTEERTWYLVAESEQDMNRWVTSICLLCGFNPTDDGPDRAALSGSSSITAMSSVSSTAAINTVTGSAPPTCDPDGSAEEDYMWLSQCDSHTRPPLGSSISLDTDYNDNLYPPPSITSSSSSSSSSPSLLPDSLPPASSSSGFRTVPWTVAAMMSPLSQSLDATVTSDLHSRAGRPRCHPSPHPRKHSLDYHLRPVAISLSDDKHAHVPPHISSSYQVPRPASTPLSRAPRRPSSTPSVDSLTQAELHACTAAPPPRPPKPPAAAGRAEAATLPRESERRGAVEEDGAGGPLRSNAAAAAGRTQTGGESLYFPRAFSERASVLEFSESFNSYFFSKGMVPLGSVCSEDDDVHENYVPMSAAVTEPPVAPREPPETSDPSTHAHGHYVPMTPLSSSVGSHPISDMAFLGRQVPPPAHMGFRSPMSAAAPQTPPLRTPAYRSAEMEAEAMPPPVHRNLKPQRKGVCVTQPAEQKDEQNSEEVRHKPRVKPAPLDISVVQQDWEEVPPPVRSPVTRTFTRDPSCRRTVTPRSSHSSSPSSDSDDPDESYVAMTKPGLSCSAGEQSLRLMLHRGSEGGVSSPLLQRTRDQKQVEYLDLDLHTGRSTPTRQKHCMGEGCGGSAEQSRAGDERAHGERARVDYVVVDPKRTRALRNTREAWHDGRMSAEKEKC